MIDGVGALRLERDSDTGWNRDVWWIEVGIIDADAKWRGITVGCLTNLSRIW